MQSKKNGKSTLSGARNVLASGWRNYSFIFVFIIILMVYVFTINANGNTFRWGHISAILSSQNTVIVGTIALGMALVIITGQIDLSVGSSLVLCSGVTIMVFNITNSILLTFLAALASGAICGLINGVLAGYAKMPPFIVTLGTMLIYRSLTLSFVREIDPAITGSSSSQFSMLSSNSNYEFLRMQFGTGSIGGLSIPYITFVFVAVMLIFVFIAKSTKYGKSVYAVGSNEKASRLAGVNVQWTKVSVFIITGILVGLASFIQASKIGNVTPASSGKSYEMYAIAAVVLGGINMAGGRGNILGVFFGALSYTTINFIIVSIPALSTDIQDTFQGLVLILVILVQTVGPVIKERFNDIRNRQKSRKENLAG
jgi:ribose transport system permease protein